MTVIVQFHATLTVKYLHVMVLAFKLHLF